jgi:methyltransferase FkbM-like protein
MVPAGTINGAWTCYCVGAGSDPTFDLELIRRYGATVRSVDPQNTLRREAEPGAAGDPRLTVIEATVAPQDGPSESGETAFDGRERPRSLRSLMEELGDQQVQLLKLNIGGDEYSLLETLDLRSLGVRVLLVELHATRLVDEALQLLERLRSQGYQPVHCTRRAGFTFVGGPSLSRHAE